MKKMTLALMLVSLILMAVVVAGLVLVDLAEDEKAAGELYAFPVSVGDKAYNITVRTNWTSAPEVYLSEFSKTVQVDFRGPDRTTVFFNMTIPADLIWGELSVYHKYYKMSEADYTISNNGTHYSIQITFNHVATVEHFEIRATEGAW